MKKLIFVLLVLLSSCILPEEQPIINYKGAIIKEKNTFLAYDLNKYYKFKILYQDGGKFIYQNIFVMKEEYNKYSINDTIK